MHLCCFLNHRLLSMIGGRWGLTCAVAAEVSQLVLIGTSDVPVHGVLFTNFYPLATELMVSAVHILSHLGDVYRADMTWLLISLAGHEPSIAKLLEVHEIQGTFFLTLGLYDSPIMPSPTSSISIELDAPVQQAGVEVICADDVLMQPLLFTQLPTGSVKLTLLL